MTLSDQLQSHLEDLQRAGRRRRLQDRVGVDFSSNDYLGLAGGPELCHAASLALARGVALGSGGSRLLRGNAPEHEALERFASDFFGADSALFVSSGFVANAMLLSTLPQRGDLLVCDELVHASVHEGAKLARCDVVRVGHSDAGAFDDAIRQWRADGGLGRPWLAVESVYSMDGDLAPLEELLLVSRENDGMLLVDEAHAAGVLGPEGRGLAPSLQGAPDVVTLVTLGKAFGCEGALILGSEVVREFLINRGRGFIFSTAPSPLMAVVAEQALRIVQSDPGRAERLKRLAAAAARRFARHGATFGGSQVLPLTLGEDRRAMEVAARLQESGYDVRAIRPPTVPAGTARLRLSITLNVGMVEVDGLDDALARALA